MSVSTLLINITPSIPFCTVSVILLRKEITPIELQEAFHMVLNFFSMIFYPEQEITLTELQ